MRAFAATFPVLCAGALLVAACGSGTTETASVPEVPPAGEVARLDAHRYLGVPFDVGNLRVWPVHTDAPLDVGDFLTLQEAQQAGVAAVREVGGQAGGGANRNLRAGQRNARAGAVQTEQVRQEDVAQEAAQQEDSGQVLLNDLGDGGGAQVGTLVIENSGDKPLLVCAGTIVKGGQQDRQIGQDIVVAAGQTVPVDAFCVEAGRWTTAREGVETSGEFVAMKAMTVKDVRAKGQYEDDQGGVWQAVAETRGQVLVAPQVRAARASGLSARPSMPSGTTLVDALEKVDDVTKEKRDAAVASILARFDELSQEAAPPVGFAYAVNGEPQTVRVFAHDRLLRKNLESFAAAMVLEAEMTPSDHPATCDANDVLAMVAAIAKDAAEKRERTAADNVNLLYSNDAGFNGNCLIEDRDGKQVPLTQDWTRR